MTELSSTEASPTIFRAVRRAADTHRGAGGALLPMLHDIQAELGCIPTEAIQPIANELNLSRADVYGVVTFYKDFRQTPAGRVTIGICRAEACQSVGADALVAHAKHKLGVEVGGTSTDGAVTLEQVFCLGNCALGPSATIGGRLYGRLSTDRFDLIMRAIAP